jgi:hypothetical protein
LVFALPTPTYDGEIVKLFDEAAYVSGSSGAGVHNWTINFGVTTVATITSNGGVKFFRWSDERSVWMVLP